MPPIAAKWVVSAGFAATALCFAIGAAERPATVADVVVLVKTGVAHRQADGSLARALEKLELIDRLDDRVVEELESLGAGPKTVGALVNLRDRSSRMPPANPRPEFDSPPAPTALQQSQAINLAAHAAAQYLAGLPDFICEEWVRRYEDWGSRGRWREKDLLEIKLTYFDLYVDRDTGETLRVNQIADSIPEDFPVTAASTRLDYDFVSVGGRQFLLPLHAEVRLTSREISTRNEVEFRGYRKFSGESKITFEPTGKL